MCYTYKPNRAKWNFTSDNFEAPNPIWPKQGEYCRNGGTPVKTGHISDFVHFHISVSQNFTFILFSNFNFKAEFILCLNFDKIFNYLNIQNWSEKANFLCVDYSILLCYARS